MQLDAAHLPALFDDLDAALDELERTARLVGAWSRGRPGKWTVGQHVEHVGHVLAHTGALLEESVRLLREGALPPMPWRGPLQALAVRVLTGKRFPRGGRAARFARPTIGLSCDTACRLMRDGARRHREAVAGLDDGERARLWFRNPFVKLRWHYTVPEIVRVQASHTRHHRRLAEEALRG